MNIRLKQVYVDENESFILNNIRNKLRNSLNMLDDVLVISKLISKEIELFAPNFTNGMRAIRSYNLFDAVCVCGLPIPVSHDSSELFVSKCMSLAFAYLVGEPFQYEQQNNGEIAAEITPTPELDNTPSSGGRVEFGWHTDDYFFSQDFRTKWIMLCGYLNPDHVKTSLAFVDDIISQLDSETLSVLMSKKFKVKVPVSICRTEYWRENISIIRVNGNQDYEIGIPTFDTKPMDDLDVTAAHSLNQLISVADKVSFSKCITDDSLIIFNNDRLLHSRSVIPNERLVLRVYVRTDVEALRMVTESVGNVFDAEKILL
ncbi:MAG: hypothetical protein EKK57_01160 [Proteobacteria bacterium]|nr:MAG: hypothetical protein EKK57_01160 [Pseudomonadota bacterium]